MKSSYLQVDVFVESEKPTMFLRYFYITDFDLNVTTACYSKSTFLPFAKTWRIAYRKINWYRTNNVV